MIVIFWSCHVLEEEINIDDVMIVPIWELVNLNLNSSSVLFWDIRPPKVQHQQSQAQDKKQAKINNPIGVPTTFKHLDLVWKPMLKVSPSHPAKVRIYGSFYILLLPSSHSSYVLFIHSVVRCLIHSFLFLIFQPYILSHICFIPSYTHNYLQIISTRDFKKIFRKHVISG